MAKVNFGVDTKTVTLSGMEIKGAIQLSPKTTRPEASGRVGYPLRLHTLRKA